MGKQAVNRLKFRVWTGLVMEYNIMAGFLGAFFVQGMDEKDSASMSSFNTIYHKETPVMQSTGMVDAQGTEIFEGDIIKLDSFEPSIYKIAFNRGAFYIAGADDHEIADIKYAEKSEVIGNIYETPDLLK